MSQEKPVSDAGRDSFSATLRDANQKDWDAAINHRFSGELFAGTIADDVMRRYLVQDYQFIDQFIALLGAAIASADRFESRLRLVRFAAMITSDENTYFLRAFDELGVTKEQQTSPHLTEPTKAFQALMAEAAGTQLYPICLSVLVVAEWLYLSWADRPVTPEPARPIHAEWITLHNNDAFAAFISWLRSELDRTAPLQNAEVRKQCADFFQRAVKLELAFFNHVYDASDKSIESA